jgi:hypothetical protein
MTAKKKRPTPASPAPAKKKASPAKTAAAPPPAPASAPQDKKVSALDAAAQVLRETGQAMSCPELIAQMADKGYWTSPKGKTPSSTLYAALTREVQRKGAAARFVKIGPGKFAYRAPDSPRP